MWTYYDLSLTVEELVGGLPKHPEIVKRWQEARWPAKDSVLQPGDPGTPAEAAERTVEALGGQSLDPGDEIAGIWTGFAERNGALVLESRQVKAMLKESANILRPLLPVRGKVIPLRNKLAERVFVSPRFIPLGVTEPTEVRERPIHVMTARGPRTALKKTDVVLDAKIACQLKVLDDGIISEEILRAILDHASVNGIGTDRSLGMGVFEFDLVKLP